MAAVSTKVKKQINDQFTKDRNYQKVLQKLVTEKLLELKKEVLDEFDSHPITREIKAGPSSSNISGTLSGKGNLFSFIGFNKNDNPIGDLRKILEKQEVRFHHIRGKTEIIIDLPTLEEIFAATPLPWAIGRSWARSMERGLSGLGYFLNNSRKAGSRSGGGIQVRSKLRGGKFKNTQYMTFILNNYYKKIEKLKRTSLA